MADPASEEVKFSSLSAVFTVENVVESANYYRDVLGFSYERFWGEPPCFVMVRRGNVEFMLKQPPAGAGARPNQQIDPGSWDAYVRVSDIGPLYEEFVSKGAKILRAPERQPYEMEEMDVEDPNGYIICFAHDISG